MEELSVLACASQPRGAGGLTGALRPVGPRKHPDLRPVQRAPWRSGARKCSDGTGGVAPSTEGGAASRASKGLDVLGTARLAIPDKRVDGSSGDPEGGALLSGTGQACGGYPSGGLPGGLSPHARGVLGQRQVSHLRSRGHRWAIKRGAGFEKMVDHRASSPCL
jgi:hypothetical protein